MLVTEPNQISKQTSQLRLIYGGTFDPPHKGHLLPLLEIADALNIGEIELIPSHVPALKSSVSASHHRLKMTEIFARQDSRLKVNDIECRSNEISYTVNTLKKLKEEAPFKTILFVVGDDSLASLPKWHKWESLFDYCHFLVLKRPVESDNKPASLASNLNVFCTNVQHFDDVVGLKKDDPTRLRLLSKLALVDSCEQGLTSLRFMDIIATSAKGNIWLFNNRQVALSSTLIRKKVKDNHDVSQYLNDKVYAYIKQHGLYK